MNNSTFGRFIQLFRSRGGLRLLGRASRRRGRGKNEGRVCLGLHRPRSEPFGRDSFGAASRTEPGGSGVHPGPVRRTTRWTGFPVVGRGHPRPRPTREALFGWDVIPRKRCNSARRRSRGALSARRVDRPTKKGQSGGTFWGWGWRWG